MRRAVGFSLIGLSSCLLACTSSPSSPPPLSPSEVLELRQAEARWATRPFQSYTYEYSRICYGFCVMGPPQPIRVIVNNGQVVGAVVVANDSALSIQGTYFKTVEGLFAEIESDAHDDWVRDVKVEFDPRWGYPTFIGWSPKPISPDVGGADEHMRNLTPTP